MRQRRNRHKLRKDPFKDTRIAVKQNMGDTYWVVQLEGRYDRLFQGCIEKKTGFTKFSSQKLFVFVCLCSD